MDRWTEWRVRCSRDVVPPHAGVKGQRASLTGALDGEDGGGKEGWTGGRVRGVRKE